MIEQINCVTGEADEHSGKTGRTHEIVLTIPKQVWMTSNDRRHWADTHRRRRTIRTMAGWWAKHLHLTANPPVTVTAEIRYPTDRRADPANAEPVVKPILDGLTDAGVWPDDDSNHIRAVTYTRGPKTGQPGKYQVALTIREEE